MNEVNHMKTDRAITICLLHVLREYSDENHILPMQEIRQKMQLLYHIQPDRRTIYSSIALLLDLGYDISTFEDNKIGYYLQSRTFEQSEILLLTDAVYAYLKASKTTQHASKKEIYTPESYTFK